MEALQKALDTMSATFEKSIAALVARMDLFETNAKAANDANFEQRLAAIELARAKGDTGTSTDTRAKSWGEAFVESDQFKSFNLDGHRGRINVGAVIKNTILGNVTGTSGGPLVVEDRQPGIVPLPLRQLRIVDALPVGRTTSNVINYVKEESFTNSAAETSEGETKPESALTFTEADAPVRTIAHWLKASKQILADAPQLASFIDNRLRYGVLRRLEGQVVAGNGTSPNLKGLTTAGNFTAFTPETGDNMFDSVNRAKYQAMASEIEVDTVFLNPVDWGTMERTKTGTTGDGAYVGAIAAAYISNGLQVSTLWGLRVVLSNSITQGNFVVLASSAVQVFIREDVNVSIYDQDGDNAVRNLVTILAEMRAAFVVYVPAAVLYGALQAA